MTIVINKINHTIEVSNGDKIVMSVPQVQVVSVGIQGPQGIQGTTGADGAAGEGIPLAGASGSFLYKSSGDDYDSAWSDNLLWDSTNKLLTVQASSFGSYKPTVSVRNASGQKEVELQQGQMAGYGGTITCYDGVDGANYVRLVYSAGYPKLSTTRNNITFETVGGARLRLGGSYISYDFNDNLDRLSVNSVSPTVQIDSRNSTHVGLLVKGATSQTANLQEWQNSSGVVKGSVNNTGSAVFANGTFNHSTASVPGALLIRDFHPDTGGYAVMELAATNFPNGKGLVFYSNTQQIQTTGTFIATGAGAGTGYFGGTGDPTSVQDQVRISAFGGNAFLYTMKYASSPYPKLVMSASGYSIRTKVGAWADLEGYGTEVIGIDTSGNVTMTAAGSAILPLCVKGAVSQSANLQEWQNSSGTTLSATNAIGDWYFSNGAKLRNLLGSNGNYLNFNGNSTEIAGVVQSVMRGQGGAQIYCGAGVGDIRLFTGAAERLRVIYNTGCIGINNISPEAQLDLTIGSVSRIGLVVKGAASQSANLQEWQDSSGVVLSSIAASGDLNTVDVISTPQASGFAANDIRIETQHYRNLPHGVSIQIIDPTNAYNSPFMRYTSSRMGLWSGNTSAGLLNSKIEFRGTQVFIDSVSGAIWFGENNSGNSNYAAVYHDSSTADSDTFYFHTGKVANVSFRPHLQIGGRTIDFKPGINGNLPASNPTVFSIGETGISTFTAAGATITPLVLKGAVSQTANLQEWQTNGGIKKLAVTSDGNALLWYHLGNMPAGTLSVNNGSGALEYQPAANYVGLIIKGSSGQTNDLQRWTNDAYSVQFGIASDGKIKTNQTSAGTTLGTVTGKMPIYNESGTLIGYIPIYDSIT